MNGIVTLGEAVSISLVDLWGRFVSFFPVFLGAVLVFLIGWAIAVTLGKLIEKIISGLRLDKASQKMGLEKKLSAIGVGEGIGALLGAMVKWFLVLVFLMAASEILGLKQVAAFLNRIVFYLPNVAVSVIILAVAFMLGNLVYGIVKGSTRAAGVMSATLLASISKWSILIFGIFASLIQLGVAESLVNAIFIGIVSMLSLAGGLAFGLGGRDEAALILRKLREELTEKK